MELLGILAAACLALLAVLLAKHLNKNKLLRIPPSPGSSLPVIGHLHLLGKLPHQSLFQLSRVHGPDFMFLKLGSVHSLVVSSARGAREVLKTHDLVFVSRPRTTVARELAYNTSNLAFAPYGEHWRFVRKFSTLELFTSKQVDSFRPLRELEVSVMTSVLQRASELRQSVDLSSLLRSLTFNIMCRMVLGKSFSGSEAQADRVFEALLEALSLTGKVYIGEVLPFLSWMDFFSVRRMRRVQRVIDEFLERELDEHRTRLFMSGKSPHESSRDFLHQMLSLGSLNDQTIKALGLDVLVAGTDTTASTLEWAMSELMKNQTLMAKAQQELQQITGRKRGVEETGDIPRLRYLQAIAKETLRLHPPAPLLIPHESVSSCKIDEYIIPEKTRVIINAYAIARDPSQWKDPEVFDPGRFLESSVDVRGLHYQLIPFGSGRRMCPGMQLGLTTLHFTLATLLNDFDWELAERDLDMSEKPGITVPRAVPLKLIPHRVL